jgi:hypothetical protein
MTPWRRQRLGSKPGQFGSLIQIRSEYSKVVPLQQPVARAGGNACGNHLPCVTPSRNKPRSGRKGPSEGKLP